MDQTIVGLDVAWQEKLVSLLQQKQASEAAHETAAKDALWSNFTVGMSVAEVRSALTKAGLSYSDGYAEEEPIWVRDDITFGRFKGRVEFYFTSGSLNHVTLDFHGSSPTPLFTDLRDALNEKYGSPVTKEVKNGYVLGDPAVPGRGLRYVYSTSDKHVELVDLVIEHQGEPIVSKREVGFWKPASYQSWLKYEDEQSRAAQAKAEAAKRKDVNSLKDAF